MEMSEQSSRSSSSNSISGFLVGRRSSSSINVLRSDRKSSMIKPNKHRGKGRISSMPWHAVFAFLNPLLIGVIQVKCQDTKFSPFDTHPVDMWTFLLATFIYCFAFAANIKWRRRCTIHALFSGHVALISGSLSSISLFSIFLPTLWGRLIFFSWFILPILVLHRYIYWPFQWTLNAISQFIRNIRKRFNINNRNLDERPQSVAVLV